MKKLLIGFLILINIFLTVPAMAQSGLPATSVRTTDGSNVQIKIDALTQSASTNTSEIIAIKGNLGTIETAIGSLRLDISTLEVLALANKANLATHETELTNIKLNLNTHENYLLALNDNIQTHEIAIVDLQLNIGTLEALALANKANLGTHETEITAIKLNLGTQEDLINTKASLTWVNTKDEILLYLLGLKLDSTAMTTHENLLTAHGIPSRTGNGAKYLYLTTDENSLIWSPLTMPDLSPYAIKATTDSLEINFLAHKDAVASAHAASAISYTDTYTLGVTTLQAYADTMAVWLTDVQNRVASIEVTLTGGSTGEVFTRGVTGYIWATIPTGVTDHLLLTNIGTKTHVQLESDITALQAGVTAKAVKSTCLYYGYPIAINDYWDETKAAEFYSKYDIIVFGDEYQQTSHETHLSTVSIISKVKVLNPDVEIFGYVPIGGTLGRNLTTAEIETAITEWNTTGATGVFLDEFGFDYMVTRERQNMAVDKAHSLSMEVMANAWTQDHVFNNDNGYCDWIPFYGNPNFVEAHINANDYYVFENLFYYYETGSQKVEDQWRVYEAYRYYYDSATESTYGVNYYETFGTKTLGLDGVDSSNASREKYYATALLGARALNLDAYCVSPINWGADTTLYPSYSLSLFAEEQKMLENTMKVQPLVATYNGDAVAKYTSTIENNIITFYWEPGATITNPALGTHKAQINGVDRLNAYTPSAASSSNTIGNLVMRDSNGDFSARVMTGALTGTASTATKLATPRNINGTPFDGSADITLPIPESGITKIYGGTADVIGSNTGEITFKEGSNVTITRTDNTIEISATGGGTGTTYTTAPIEILNIDYTTSDYNVLTVTGVYDTASIIVTVNGLLTSYTSSTTETQTILTLTGTYEITDAIKISQFTGLATVLGGTGTFNAGTGTTITIGNTMPNTTYKVTVTATSDTNGTVGDIFITNKTSTSFKVKCSGSNTTATFDWILKQ